MDAQAENGGSRFQQKQKTTAPKSGPPPHPKNPLGSSDSATQQSSYNYEKTKGPTAGRSEGRGPTPPRHPPPIPPADTQQMRDIVHSNPKPNPRPKSTQAQRATQHSSSSSTHTHYETKQLASKCQRGTRRSRSWNGFKIHQKPRKKEDTQYISQPDIMQ